MSKPRKHTKTSQHFMSHSRQAFLSAGWNTAPALQRVASRLGVQRREVGVPALRPHPWIAATASPVGQLVAVWLPPVVLPGKVRRCVFGMVSGGGKRGPCAEHPPVSPHAFVLRADVSGWRESLSATTVIIPPPLSAAVPLPAQTHIHSAGSPHTTAGRCGCPGVPTCLASHPSSGPPSLLSAPYRSALFGIYPAAFCQTHRRCLPSD